MSRSSSRRARRHAEEPELPWQWQKVQGAIWLIGLALLFYTGWWMPGILILVAISGLTQAAIYGYVQRQEKAEQSAAAQQQAAEAQRRFEAARLAALPANCPGCGAALDPAKVTWPAPTTAACPYCQTAIKVNVEETGK